MVIQSYAEAFWGGDLISTSGFDALVARNREGKKMCQELEDYFKKRAKVESQYSKDLSNLGKIFKSRDSTGVLETSLNLLKSEIDVIGISHSAVCDFFSQMSDKMKKFREEQNTKKKQKEEALQKTQSAKISQFSKAVELEKNYYKKCADRDAAVTLANEAKGENPPRPQKELEKINARASKAEDEVQKADNSYKSSVHVLDSNTAEWEKEMKSFCQVCQELDEVRIKFLRQEIWTCTNVGSKLALDIDNSCDKVRVKLQECDIEDDIKSYIQAAKTGSEKPERFRYKRYGQRQTPIEIDDSSNDYVDIDSIRKQRDLSKRRK